MWSQQTIMESMLESLLQCPSVQKEIYVVHLDRNHVSVCIAVVTLGVETRSSFTETMKLNCVNFQ
jgi:hypothetical protein